MKTEITVNTDAMEISLNGRLDSTTAPELEREVNSRLEGIANLTLDFTQLNYIASAGLRVVLALKKRMNAVEGTMIILNPNELVTDVFEATGFADILEIRRVEGN